jgi:hypothetical protein
MHRRTVLWSLALVSLGCASSPPSRLHTLGKPSGSGEIELSVENRGSAIVNNLFVATTRKVKAAPRPAFEEGTPEQAALWGEDLLRSSGLEPGGKLRVPVPGPGRYDFRAVDRDGRWQHVAGLSLKAGGRYVLELGDAGWRSPK